MRTTYRSCSSRCPRTTHCAATADHPRTDRSARREIEDAIGRVAKELPGEDDIARVTSRLEAGGRPLATPTSERPLDP
ncbi:DUF3349 domain-containing protein [Nocardia vaccinii]|uniref:DUF3349 domain-containing protein n=1 Tax=Nocardia vaccinii TaxID=1822 RepID=UPI000A04B678|nr:DUF3349 domain-containing protein [Nocardia vaccinii]